MDGESKAGGQAGASTAEHAAATAGPREGLLATVASHHAALTTPTAPILAAQGASTPAAGDAGSWDRAFKEGVVVRLFEAFGQRELTSESVLALAHPEIVFEPMTAQVTQAGDPYVGHEGIRRYAEDLQTHWSELTIQLTQVRAAGHAVVALGLVSGRGAAGSFERVPATWVVKFRDGLVAYVQVFSDERAVMEALVGEEG
jgi:ketosteroid isomerase-like protein